jgi:hypothetical protein
MVAVSTILLTLLGPYLNGMASLLEEGLALLYRSSLMGDSINPKS